MKRLQSMIEEIETKIEFDGFGDIEDTEYLLGFADDLRDILASEYPLCSQPNDRWPPQINACLREVLAWIEQESDPESYRKKMADATKKTASKPIKGSAQGGRKD